MMDSKEAVAALGEIEAISRRVRQSKFYRISSVMMVLWGVLTALGYIVTFVAPVWAKLAWAGVYVLGAAGTW